MSLLNRQKYHPNLSKLCDFCKHWKFSIQLQAAWHLTSNISTVNYDSNRFVPSLKRFGHCIDYFSAGPNVYLSKLEEHKLTHEIIILLTVDADTLNNWARWSSGIPCLSLQMTIKMHQGAINIKLSPFLLVVCPHCNQTQCCCQFWPPVGNDQDTQKQILKCLSFESQYKKQHWNPLTYSFQS